MTFAERLTRCLRDGRMTVSDLAVFFQRPRSTTNKWVNGAFSPRGPLLADTTHRLQLLEMAIRLRLKFPVPSTLSQLKRANYVAQARDELLAFGENRERTAVPRDDTASRG